MRPVEEKNKANILASSISEIWQCENKALGRNIWAAIKQNDTRLVLTYISSSDTSCSLRRIENFTITL